MSINLLNMGERATIRQIGGKEATRKHLENLGVVCGQQVRIISKVAGSLILEVKGTRLALDQRLTRAILV